MVSFFFFFFCFVSFSSRPEKYVYPKTDASKLSGNYYFQRDTRRNFPRLAVYTQQDVAGLLTGASVEPR